MKAAALVIECEGGKFHAIGSDSVGGLRDLARAIRASGEIEIGKKVYPVKAGTILASWRSAPDMRFRVTR
jgi:hypothetical protein